MVTVTVGVGKCRVTLLLHVNQRDLTSITPWERGQDKNGVRGEWWWVSLKSTPVSLNNAQVSMLMVSLNNGSGNTPHLPPLIPHSHFRPAE